jgi:hypothetical protein
MYCGSTAVTPRISIVILRWIGGRSADDSCLGGFQKAQFVYLLPVSPNSEKDTLLQKAEIARESH